MRSTILKGIAILAFCLPAAAPGRSAPPVPVMDTSDHSGGWVGKAAAPFTLPDSDGKTTDLGKVLGTRPVVLIFYRGAWCPFCRGQMADLARHQAELQASGAAVYAISNEAASGLKSMRDGQKVGFITFLSDPDGAAAKLYAGLYPNSMVHQPGSFVVDKHGKIVYAYVNEDFRSRAATTALVQAVKRSR